MRVWFNLFSLAGLPPLSPRREGLLFCKDIAGGGRGVGGEGGIVGAAFLVVCSQAAPSPSSPLPRRLLCCTSAIAPGGGEGRRHSEPRQRYAFCRETRAERGSAGGGDGGRLLLGSPGDHRLQLIAERGA